MSLCCEERPSESSLVATITQGQAVRDGFALRPAECHWHIVCVKHKRNARVLVVGPWSSAGVAEWEEGAELLWIKFLLGVHLSRVPARRIMDTETCLPFETSRSFLLQGSAWEVPTFENADTFVNRLVRKRILARDAVVQAVLQGEENVAPTRTVRHRFRQTVGLTQTHVQQMERAQQAAALLRRGATVTETVYAAGYFDQPHLTRAMKRWIGRTPAEIAQRSKTM